jgi:hypothetical protein
MSQETAFSGAYLMLTHGFRVKSDIAQVSELVPALLAPFESRPMRGMTAYRLASDGAGDDPYTISVNGTVAARVTTSLGLIDELLWHANGEAIRKEDRSVAIHAAAASYDGVGVILPAAPDSGKSTTVAGLLRAGFGYLTDEAALIDSVSCEVKPYPKPIWLAPPSVRAIPELQRNVLPPFRSLDRIRTYIRPQDLGTAGIAAPCPIRLVVSPRYIPGSPLKAERLSKASTMMCLAENAFNLGRIGPGAIHTLRAVADSAEGFQLRFGQLEEATELITRLLEEMRS